MTPLPREFFQAAWDTPYTRVRMLVDVPVIDVFAGPGGLAEGFSSFCEEGERPFRITLSIEKDANAHQTLQLRSFVRQFGPEDLPGDYFRYLRAELSRDELFANFPEQARAAEAEAWLKTLGPSSRKEVSRRISLGLHGRSPWILVGGPPCQAYSLVGRSRMRNRKPDFATDHRHTLYREYLSILADHAPDVFVLENVKGLLSSVYQGRNIFEQIVEDLQRPRAALRRPGPPLEYCLFPLASGVSQSDRFEPTTFLLRSENYGIPQARHRVIVLGIRKDRIDRLGAGFRVPTLEAKRAAVPVVDAIGDLSLLRSGVSKAGEDSHERWASELSSVQSSSWIRAIGSDVRTGISEALQAVRKRRDASRGGEFFNSLSKPSAFAKELRDDRLAGVCNHSTRAHIAGDLHRYLFASAFASVRGYSPKLEAFPAELLPRHGNVDKGVSGQMFSDRFRVQLRDLPSTTVTSHIAKDGHYFIHYDPTQARSLTVREAARLQTFPDNYFFEGPRTSQYHQVGNAVPPALARQIARAVYSVLKRLG